MKMMTQISVPVTVEERSALAALAEKELRHPRDQARYLLRLALLGAGDDLPTPTGEGKAMTTYTITTNNAHTAQELIALEQAITNGDFTDAAVTAMGGMIWFWLRMISERNLDPAQYDASAQMLLNAYNTIDVLEAAGVRCMRSPQPSAEPAAE